MRIDKAKVNKCEFYGFIIAYIILFANAYITQDSAAALISAFCGISYTILAGKGIPACYLIGVVGSAFYSYLSFHNALWGNLILYAGYYIPMQILGFFQWNMHLKDDKQEIIKISLPAKESLILSGLGISISAIVILLLIHFGDKSPYIDGITTVFSILGMYLTVRRAIEQWIIWMIVNGLSLIMWLCIALNGEKVYSTVIMWTVYFILSIYFYFTWRKEIFKLPFGKN